MSVTYIQAAAGFLRKNLPVVEEGFNYLGVIPVVHRVSGGIRIIFGAWQVGLSLVFAVVIHSYGSLRESPALQKEGVKVLDFAVHGFGNITRGFIEAHKWFHFICFLQDHFVKAEKPPLGLRYDRPIFGR